MAAGLPSRIELYRLLGDADRLRILALCSEETLSVGELGALLNESQPNISRKLAPLRQVGLLEAKKDGTRLWLQFPLLFAKDAVILDGLEEGRRLCAQDGSLAKLPAVVAAREDFSKAYFEETASLQLEGNFNADASSAYLMAVSGVISPRALAVDMGTGDGSMIDILAPIYDRVIAVDRSPARLAKCASRVAHRGFHHVSLLQADFDDVALLERVSLAGGADLVVSCQSLHHAARPQLAVAAFSRLLKRGGYLQIMDYLPHHDEQMREAHGDVWLGFDARDLEKWVTENGLHWRGARRMPPAFHRHTEGAHLEWQVTSAQKPLSMFVESRV